MSFHRSAALIAAAMLLFSVALPAAAVADKQAPSTVKELALKIKGWHCDG